MNYYNIVMINCCIHNKTHKKCVRKLDNKIFSLPRRFTRRRCQKGIRGFTMRSSCAPYKNCIIKGGEKTKRREKGKKKINKTIFRLSNALGSPISPKTNCPIASGSMPRSRRYMTPPPAVNIAIIIKISSPAYRFPNRRRPSEIGFAISSITFRRRLKGIIALPKG